MVVTSLPSAQARGEGGQNSAYGSLRHFYETDRISPASHGDRLRRLPAYLSMRPAASTRMPAAPRCRQPRRGGPDRGASRRSSSAGQIRPRPAEGREPELPPPTIREYKPRSTLVVPQHPVPRAKFPVIDIHGHPPSADHRRRVSNSVVEAMDPLNLQVMVNASGASGERLTPGLAAIRASRYKDRMVMFAQHQLARRRARLRATNAPQQLEADVKAGALGARRDHEGLRHRRAQDRRHRASSSMIPSSIRCGTPRRG